MRKRDWVSWAEDTPLSKALHEALPAIAKNRRRMSIEDAEDTIRMALRRHGATLHPAHLKDIARTVHRGPTWIFRHPMLARREGWLLDLPWRRDRQAPN